MSQISLLIPDKYIVLWSLLLTLISKLFSEIVTAAGISTLLLLIICQSLRFILIQYVVVDTEAVFTSFLLLLLHGVLRIGFATSLLDSDCLSEWNDFWLNLFPLRLQIVVHVLLLPGEERGVLLHEDKLAHQRHFLAVLPPDKATLRNAYSSVILPKIFE